MFQFGANKFDHKLERQSLLLNYKENYLINCNPDSDTFLQGCHN